MSKRKLVYIAFCIVSLGLAACQTEPTKKAKDSSAENPVRINFNADTCFQYVVEQVAFGPRVPSTKAHERCASYLVKKLQGFGASVFIQNGNVKTFDGKTHQLKNIIASFQPTISDRILLAAHWDTRPFADQGTEDTNKPIDGANDGASGVAVLLELARNLQIQPSKVGVDIILFDVEDYGQPENSIYPQMADSYCLGSQFWAKNQPSQNYQPRFGILLDMVGGANAVFTQEEVSRVYAPTVLKKVWTIASQSEYANYFSYEASPAIIDDHYYVNVIRNIPMIDIIHRDNSSASGFWKYWHTQNDRIENIDKNTLKAVGQVVANVVYSEK